MDTTTTPVLLLAREVAQQFRVEVKTVARWARKGWLTAIKTPGGAYRYPENEVAQLLREGPPMRYRCTVCGKPLARGTECFECFIGGDDAFRRQVDQ